MSTVEMLGRRYPTKLVPACNVGFELLLDDIEIKKLGSRFCSVNSTKTFISITEFLVLLHKVEGQQ